MSYPLWRGRRRGYLGRGRGVTKRFKKRRIGTYRSSRQARARLNQRTAGFAGLELKFLDLAWNGVGVSVSTDGADGEMQPSTPAAILCCTAPVQGTAENQNDGRVYTLKSLWVSGIIDFTSTKDQSDPEEQSGYYFALVLDTQSNAATMVSENVYINPGTSALQMLPKPLRNLEQSHRFRILDSQYIAPMGIVSTTDHATNSSTMANIPAGNPIINLSWKGNIVVRRSNTTGVVGSITDNAIHLIAYAGSSVFTPIFQGKGRLRFMG